VFDLGLCWFLFRWVDPGGSGKCWRLRGDALEADWMSRECGVERDGTLRGERCCGSVVDGSRSHQADTAVAVFVVVPVEELLAVSTSILGRAEANTRPRSRRPPSAALVALQLLDLSCRGIRLRSSPFWRERRLIGHADLARTLRGPRLARFPSPRNAVDHGLRIPGLRKGDDSPSEPRSAGGIEKPALPSGYRPRGAPDQARAPRPQLDRHDPTLVGRRDRTNHATMPTLLRTQPSAKCAPKFMTQ
jgi:hypothetical protein